MDTSIRPVPQAGISAHQEADDDHTEPIFTQDMDKKYVCPICLSVLKDVMQTVCGHRFCAACIHRVRKNQQFVRCPVDNTWFRCADEMYSDVAFQREILSLEVKCVNPSCDWKGEYRDLEAHTDACPCGLVSCEFSCSEIVMRKDLSTHLETCDQRPVQCQHCNEPIVSVYVTRHQVLECVKFPVQCSLCSQTGILRQDIKKHLDKTYGQCPNVFVPCTYLKYGCHFQDKRCTMPSHEQEYVHSHLMLVEKHVSSQETKISTLSNELENVTSVFEARQTELEATVEKFIKSSDTNYDGHLLWKVAISDNESMYQSKPFYTGRPGYKMHMSMELTSHEGTADKFVSIFLNLEKGQYDQDLLFPYHGICDVTVLAQEPTSHHYNLTIDCTSMLPWTTSESIRGRHRFMHSVLLLSDKYCKDDTLFLDVRVRSWERTV